MSPGIKALCVNPVVSNLKSLDQRGGGSPGNNSHRPNAGLMLGHRLRRWPNGYFFLLAGGGGEGVDSGEPLCLSIQP